MMRYLPALCLFLAIPALAQEKTDKSEKTTVGLRWFGHSYFLLTTTAGTRVAFDPHSIAEYAIPLLAPDCVCVSHPHDDHNRIEIFSNAKDVKVFQGIVAKGKGTDWARLNDKFKDVKIRTVGTFHDEDNGLKRGKNSAFLVEADGLKFCHLGDLGHELSEETVREIGPVDVLMIPVGGIYTLNGEKAKNVVAAIKPRLFVLPMHYGTKVYTDVQTADEFLDGARNVRKLEDTNLLEIPLNLKPDAPTVVILGWK
jgi:L-ascorbate metabolism protein UlaG (beta-lactamase superfamily)